MKSTQSIFCGNTDYKKPCPKGKKISYKDGITSYISNTLPSQSQVPQVTISVPVYSIFTVFYAYVAGMKIYR